MRLPRRNTPILRSVYGGVLALLAACLVAACSPKYGCPINEEAGPKVDKNGELSTKRGKTRLFSKPIR